MNTVYLDGYAVEYVFNAAELQDALAYWSARGTVEVRPSPNSIALYAA